jgi:DNA-binding NarL/FixJ family response regulator
MKSGADKVEESERQTQVLELLSKGLTRKEICEKTKLKLGTVNTYISRAYAKLDSKKAASALMEYVRTKHPELDLFPH